MTDEEFLNELSLLECPPEGAPEGTREGLLELIARFRGEAVSAAGFEDFYGLQKWKEIPPSDLVLHCPECGQLHLDLGEFSTRPHRRHLCENTPSGRTGCGHLWRPHLWPTRGVLHAPKTLFLHHSLLEGGEHEAYYFSQGRPVTAGVVRDRNLSSALARARLCQLKEFALNAEEAPACLRFVDVACEPRAAGSAPTPAPYEGDLCDDH